MNSNCCSNFKDGTTCGGIHNSEMCGKCACFSLKFPFLVHPVTQSDGGLNAEVKASETQVGGTHYIDMGIQPLEYTYANYGYIGLKAAIHNKVNKYLGRVKDNEVEQLKKARHCIALLIEKAELL